MSYFISQPFLFFLDKKESWFELDDDVQLNNFDIFINWIIICGWTFASIYFYIFLLFSFIHLFLGCKTNYLSLELNKNLQEVSLISNIDIKLLY